MDAGLRKFVWGRAKSVCEYCGIPDEYDSLPFCVDHVIALKHGGSSKAQNLALSCFNCNAHKGPNIAGVDPLTGRLVRLFDPRRDMWRDHFAWSGAALLAKSDIGRVTIYVLEINGSRQVENRRQLHEEGLFPWEEAWD